MMGMSFVVLSSLWNGRINSTRITFVYLAGLAFYYGAIKPNIDTSPIDNHKTTLEPKSGYTPPLPMPTPRNYK